MTVPDTITLDDPFIIVSAAPVDLGTTVQTGIGLLVGNIKAMYAGCYRAIDDVVFYSDNTLVRRLIIDDEDAAIISENDIVGKYTASEI